MFPAAVNWMRIICTWPMLTSWLRYDDNDSDGNDKENNGDYYNTNIDDVTITMTVIFVMLM